MPTLTRTHRRSPLAGRTTLCLGALVAFALTTAPVEAAPPPDATAPAPGIVVTSAYADTVPAAPTHADPAAAGALSAPAPMATGAAALAALSLVLLYAGAQRKAKAKALAELHCNEAALRAAVAAAPVAMVMTDERGDVALWNPAAEALFGMTADRTLGRPATSLFANEKGQSPDFAELLVPDQPQAPGDAAAPKHIDAVHAKGHRIPVRAAFAALGGGRSRRTFGIVCRSCRTLEYGLDPQVADTIIDNAGESIVITDSAGTALRVNAAYCRLTGYTAEEVIGANQRVLNSGHHDRAFFASMWSALLEEGRWEGKIWNRRKDGSIFLENLTIVALRDTAGTFTHFVGIFTDITHPGLDPAQISQLAFYDPLTGLATRELLIDHLSAAARHGRRNDRRVALFYLNLDDFKQVNKDHGHTVGDALLKRYAELLEARVRQEDTVARPSGDEFALVLGGIASLEDVPRVADKLVRGLAEPLDHEGLSFSLQASIGISIYPDHSQDVERLLELAKGAMSKAKAAGKNRWIMHHQVGGNGGTA